MQTALKCLLIIGALPAFLFAQEPLLWSTSFGGSGNDAGKAVCQTFDGGYVITGPTHSWGASGQDIFLLKVDATGAEQWMRVINSPGNETAYCVIQTADGGYALAGALNITMYDLEMDVLVLRTDSLGNTIWSHTYNGGGIDCGYSIAELNDGSIIVAGIQDGCLTGGEGNVLLMKLNGMGNVLWQNTYDYRARDCAYAMTQTPEGDFLIAGACNEDPYGGFGEILLMKIDGNGNLLCAREYDYGVAQSIELTQDGNIAVAGWTVNSGPGEEDMMLMNTDFNGHLLWKHVYGTPYANLGRGAVEAAEGGFLVYGSDFIPLAISHRSYFVRTADNGFAMGEYRIPEGSNYPCCAIVNNEGNFIFTGSTIIPGGANYEDILLAELADDFGSIVVNLNPENYNLQIPGGGGAFNYDIQLANNSLTAGTVDLVIEVRDINAGWLHEILHCSDITLIPGQSIFHQGLRQNVPPGLNASHYVYSARVIDANSSSTLFTSSLSFEILANGNNNITESGWILNGWNKSETFLASKANDFLLAAPYPNPFNAAVKIGFSLARAGRVKLSIFDITGREIAVLAEGWYESGKYETEFSGRGLASGIYYALLKVNGEKLTRKIVLLK